MTLLIWLAVILPPYPLATCCCFALGLMFSLEDRYDQGDGRRTVQASEKEFFRLTLITMNRYRGLLGSRCTCIRGPRRSVVTVWGRSSASLCSMVMVHLLFDILTPFPL